MDNLKKNNQAIVNWLVLPVFSPKQYSEKVRNIWKSLNSDPDIVEKIPIEKIAEQQGETPKSIVTKVAFHREEIEMLTSFAECHEYENVTVISFPESDMFIKMKIEKFHRVVQEFENQVVEVEQEVHFVQVHPDHRGLGSTERQDDED